MAPQLGNQQEYLAPDLRSIQQSNKVPNDTQHPGADKFPPTRWSVIDAARSDNPSERERALETLFAAYWKPVYKYVRVRWNRSAEDAQDLTQGFFAELLERDLLAKYAPEKSRLRTFLRVCVDSFVMNQDKASLRQKRGGNVLHVALDFESAEGELRGRVMSAEAIPSPESVEQFFEKEWIRSLFALAVEDLRRLCQERERGTTFRLFEEYDLDGEQDISYGKLAQMHGISATDVTNALAWARREFRRIALDRLREICGSYDEFQREVLSVFGKPAR
jgi:RNA polymerase sigma factor (sigma-70 family)